MRPIGVLAAVLGACTPAAVGAPDVGRDAGDGGPSIVHDAGVDAARPDAPSRPADATAGAPLDACSTRPAASWWVDGGAPPEPVGCTCRSGEYRVSGRVARDIRLEIRECGGALWCAVSEGSAQFSPSGCTPSAGGIVLWFTSTAGTREVFFPETPCDADWVGYEGLDCDLAAAIAARR